MTLVILTQTCVEHMGSLLWRILARPAGDLSHNDTRINIIWLHEDIYTVFAENNLSENVANCPGRVHNSVIARPTIRCRPKLAPTRPSRASVLFRPLGVPPQWKKCCMECWLFFANYGNTRATSATWRASRSPLSGDQHRHTLFLFRG